MDWALLLLAGGGTGWYAGWAFREHRAARRQRTEQLAAVRSLAEEDVTLFGDQLRQLDAELAGSVLDGAARDHFGRALDAYERAGRAASSLREPDQVGGLLDTIASGRYAMACVRARAANREVPEPRPPCYFNPQHGQSVLDVEWTPPTRGTRTVPACRQCAARVRAHQAPDLRMVQVGSRRVPYGEAGSVFLPDRHGRCAAKVSATGPSVSWVLDTAITGDTDLGHYSGGHPISA